MLFFRDIGNFLVCKAKGSTRFNPISADGNLCPDFRQADRRCFYPYNIAVFSDYFFNLFVQKQLHTCHHGYPAQFPVKKLPPHQISAPAHILDIFLNLPGIRINYFIPIDLLMGYGILYFCEDPLGKITTAQQPSAAVFWQPHNAIFLKDHYIQTRIGGCFCRP